MVMQVAVRSTAFLVIVPLFFLLICAGFGWVCWSSWGLTDGLHVGLDWTSGCLQNHAWNSVVYIPRHAQQFPDSKQPCQCQCQCGQDDYPSPRLLHRYPAPSAMHPALCKNQAISLSILQHHSHDIRPATHKCPPLSSNHDALAHASSLVSSHSHFTPHSHLTPPPPHLHYRHHQNTPTASYSIVEQKKMAQNNPGGDDYLDKAFNFAATKFGGAQGQKIANNRGLSEKITDGMRKAYEKVTGTKVDPKISN